MTEQALSRPASRAFTPTLRRAIHWAFGAPLSSQARNRLLVESLLVGDTAMIALAYWLALHVRFFAQFGIFRADGSPASLTWPTAGLLLLLWLAVMALYHLYDHHYLLGGTEEYSLVFTACTVATLVLVMLTFLIETFILSRGWLILFWAFTTGLLILSRFTFRRLIYALRQRGHLLAPAVIVGANEEGIALVQQLQSWRTSGLYLTGFADQECPVGTEVFNGYSVVCSLGDLERWVRVIGVEEVIVAPTAFTRPQLVDIFRMMGLNKSVNLRLSSGLFEIMTTGLRVKELSYVPLIGLNRVRLRGIEVILKWLIDVGIGLPLLLLLSPLMLAIAIAVKLDSAGPVIHRRRVMGMGGREIDAFKFRTMRVDGDRLLQARPELQAELERNHKLRDDPRVTRFGRLLRKSSLDELPQLFNVLKRQMSLVGPRMISPPEMAEYEKWGMNLLTVRPGLTGLWQVSGRSDVSYRQRVQLDMQYIRNWTVWLDLQLLLHTLPAVLKRRGAY